MKKDKLLKPSGPGSWEKNQKKQKKSDTGKGEKKWPSEHSDWTGPDCGKMESRSTGAPGLKKKTKRYRPTAGQNSLKTESDRFLWERRLSTRAKNQKSARFTGGLVVRFAQKAG